MLQKFLQQFCTPKKGQFKLELIGVP